MVIDFPEFKFLKVDPDLSPTLTCPPDLSPVRLRVRWWIAPYVVVQVTHDGYDRIVITRLILAKGQV